MNQNFFLWYYTQGIQNAFSLYGNLLRFIEHRFHIFGLLRTFFSPWKRDVTFKNWRGFHPLKSLSAFAENMIARFMGMLVRSFVIGAGIVLELILLILGAMLVCVYVLCPLLLGLGLVFLLINPLLGAMLLMLGIGGGILSFVGFLLRHKEEEETFDIVVLRKKRWFPRLIARLVGVDKNSLDPKLFENTDALVNFLGTIGIDRVTYEQTVALERQRAIHRDAKSRFWNWENLHTVSAVGKGWSYAYTPHLDRYCLDLSQYDPTQYAHAKLIGRQDELKIASVVLERPTQNSVILVGEPGIGKKTFIHSLARQIRENAFEKTALGNARVLLFDVGRAVSAGSDDGGEVESFMRDLFSEAAYAGNVILAIENIDVFLGGDTSHRTLAPLFSEFLALPGFRMIATSTTSHYHALAKVDEQVLKFLETVYLRETNEEETLQVLMQHFEPVERKRVVFSIKSLQSIVASASRYNWEVPFPERAIDLAQEVLTYWQGTAEPVITPETVSAFVSLKTGVPTGGIGAEEKEKLLKLEELLHVRVIGQHEAVKQVAEAMRKARAGFGNDKRPLGSFIFLGPTGVGKTETVKAFAESYFGSDEKMIRLDMSEYQNPESVTRLIGSQETKMQGQLTTLVKEKPFSILLLDEVEKAYPKVLDLFLQILDEGFVTDGFGEKVSFRNMIIIATSNAGAPLIKSLLEKGSTMEAVRKVVLDSIVQNNVFRLEFLNRFDGMIFFEPLQKNELIQVTKLKLGNFAKRLKKEKNILIEFSEGVAEKIVEKGYQPEFGARSINRYIENTIEDTVVKQIISGEVSDGGKLSVSANEL